MNVRTALVVALLAAPFSAQAGDTIRQLSEHTGLSERKVQMILGNRTSFAEYPYTYQRSAEQFRHALGEENYQRLMNGQAVVLQDAPGKDEAIRVAREDASARAKDVQKQTVTGS
ncbi:hypothetical protein MMG85_01760 [Pseudoxanthomonas sp. LH2527]|uniref:hypothetical protein n=1 Tax=Pseudoxanthomonas sp. LH2527 TaxID=2923249 RepID=UPI001F13629C|nr:hypothetical protein [Pseudoxanthomonas sp. LH2527]MCH6482297.1 hypothetical protein [Pseudoxanthomonas sp. LH2527]